jgi:hypothetical protein
MDIGAKEIDIWHKNKGWDGNGYQDVIRRDGTLEFGRDENDVGAHVEGYNSESVGICMVGGVDKDENPENNFTKAQFKTLKRSLSFYNTLFPEAKVVGHNDLNPHKACPSFNVGQWLENNV